MDKLAQTCERIAATTKKTEKVSLLAEYFRAPSVEDAAVSAVFLSGRAFPAHEERTLQVGGALLWSLLEELTRVSEPQMRAAYRKHGDLGSAAFELLATRSKAAKAVSAPLSQVQNTFDEIAATRTATAKEAILK